MSGLLAVLLAATALGQPAPARLSDDDRRRALLLADLLIQSGRHGEAEEFMRERYELGLDTAAWTVRYARLRAAQRRHGDAADHYRALLAASPEDTGLMLQLGLQEDAAGRPAEARRWLEKARALSSNPAIPYHLAELEFDAGRAAEGRRWAEAALAELPDPGQVSDSLMRLRLRSRLGFDDAVESAYGRLYERNPKEEGVLFEWASALMRAGAPEEAAEPLALLAERFPEEDLERRRLEADRLRRLGDDAARRAFIEESLAAHPGEPSFLYARAESQLRRRRWDLAEAAAVLLATSPYARAAEDVEREARERGWRHAGPLARWKDSNGTRVVETGAAYRGMLRPFWRFGAEASRAAYHRKASGARAETAGLHAELAKDTERWEAGLDADARGGNAPGTLSPGAFAELRREAWSARGRASWRRLWSDSAEAVAAGVLADEAEASGRLRPLRRVALSVAARYNRLSARAGGRAHQTLLAPEAVLVLLERPLYAAASWRYVAVDASGDALFFANLPLLRRSRAQYGALSAGGRWFRQRLRAEGYVFNGHEPERGRRFGSGNLLGFGASLEWSDIRWALSAGYSLTREDALGVGGRSETAKLAAVWRWP